MNLRNKSISYTGTILCSIILIFILILFFRCESPEGFYRPDLPEKLCSIGIVDIDDTTLRHMSFEKSFQSEYEHEVNDSLRDFSFSISSSHGELFSYQCDSTVKSIKNLKIPDSIVFHPGQKYTLTANEKGMEEITAEVMAPSPPPEPRLVSHEFMNTILPEPAGCIDTLVHVRTVRIKISFKKNKNQYYAILLRGWGHSLSSSWLGWPPWLDFTVVDGNAPGFLAVVQGLVTYHFPCYNIEPRRDPTFAYFIDGENIRGPECLLTLSVQYRDRFSMIEMFKTINVKVISIPRELYLFEKSLYTYGKVSGDPFAEPIYINGNIKGGNGIFALCRSKELKITFSSWI